MTGLADDDHLPTHNPRIPVRSTRAWLPLDESEALPKWERRLVLELSHDG